MRIALTVLLGITYHVLRQMPLPGWSDLMFDLLPAAVVDVPRLAAPVETIFASFVTVEIAAAIVPGWRVLRTGGPSGRARLDLAAIAVAGALVAVQSASLAAYLRSRGWDLSPSTGVLWTLSAAAGTFFVAWLSAWISKYGLGQGWSVLLLVDIVSEILWGASSVSSESGGGLVPALAVTLAVGFVTLWVVRLPRLEPSRWLPLPTTGLFPLFLMYAFVNLVASEPTGTFSAAFFGIPLSIRLVVYALGALVIGVICQITYFDDGRAVLEAGTARRSLLASVSLLWLLIVVDELLWSELWLPSVTLVLAVAILLDLANEAGFRLQHGETGIVESLSHPEKIESRVRSLTDASLPFVVRGYAHRVMLQFFGPYVPLDVLVRRDNVEKVRELLAGSPRVLDDG